MQKNNWEIKDYGCDRPYHFLARKTEMLTKQDLLDLQSLLNDVLESESQEIMKETLEVKGEKTICKCGSALICEKCKQLWTICECLEVKEPQEKEKHFNPEGCEGNVCTGPHYKIREEEPQEKCWKYCECGCGAKIGINPSMEDHTAVQCQCECHKE